MPAARHDDDDDDDIGIYIIVQTIKKDFKKITKGTLKITINH